MQKVKIVAQTALLLLPPPAGQLPDDQQVRVAFELWWQGATSVAIGVYRTPDHFPVPVDYYFPCGLNRYLPVCLALWLRYRQIMHVAVFGHGASGLVKALLCRHIAAVVIGNSSGVSAHGAANTLFPA